jgi:spore maturation protein CgeB
MAGTTQLYFVESLEIEEYYVPDKEIVLYNSVGEFEEKVRSLLEGPADVCLGIAAAAQQRTLADHTYRNRAIGILEAAAQVGIRYPAAQAGLMEAAIQVE